MSSRTDRTAIEVGEGEPLRIALVNPPSVVVDPAQLEASGEAVSFGLYRIASWLRSRGHEVHFADMSGLGGRRRPWKELVARLELVLGPGRLPTGAEGLDLDYWLHGRPPEWLDSWLDGLCAAPDEIWVTCALPYDGFVARTLVQMVRRRYPAATVRFGGAYPSRLPDDAARSGADEVFAGRIGAADHHWPDPADLPEGLGFLPFRLLTGGEGGDALPLSPLLDGLEAALGGGAFTELRCLDDALLLHRPALEAFLGAASARALGLPLGFPLGLEPDLLDRPLLDGLRAAGAGSLTLSVGSADPRLAGLGGRPATALSAIRAIEALRAAGFDPGRCRGLFDVGLPDERIDDLFAVFHALAGAGLVSRPVPVAPVPGSPAHDRYGRRLVGRRLAALNGHLFPLLGNPNRVNLYRRLLVLLRAKDRAEAEAMLGRFPGWVAEAYERGRRQAEALAELALSTDEPDGVELLGRIPRRESEAPKG